MKARTPKVTILALAYNHAEYLTDTLDSIRRQTFQDFELFIADDASSDQSAQLIRDWDATHQAAKQLFLHDQNVGLCGTLNELLSCATGEYIQIIACDDQLLPQCLERKVRTLDLSGNHVAAVYTDANIMDDAGATQKKTFLKRFLKNKPAPTGDLFFRLLLGNFLPAMSVLAKRTCIEEVGAFDDSLTFEDWDLWLRLSRRYDFLYDQVPSVRYRLHDSNMHRVMKHVARQNYRILSKHRDVFRARMRIMLTIARNVNEFDLNTPEVDDFLSWADQYVSTKWFRRGFIGKGNVAQKAVLQIVETSEGITRPFSQFAVRPQSQEAA